MIDEEAEEGGETTVKAKIFKLNNVLRGNRGVPGIRSKVNRSLAVHVGPFLH